MIYFLEYRENGKKKEKPIDIEFVSNRYIKNYRKLESKIKDFENCVKEYENNLQNRAKLIVEKNVDELKKLEKDFIEIKRKVESFQQSDIFETRLELIRYLYHTNGIEYEGDEFWDNCIEPATMNEFLKEVVSKDFNDTEVKKKALTNYMKTALSEACQNTGDQ